MAVSIETVLATVENWAPVFVEVAADGAAGLPARWQPVVRSADPGTRCEAAMAVWNRDFLDLVPRFAGTLRDRLVDVRACLADGDPVLVYVATADDGGYVSWVGYDPRTFGADPPFWDAVPAPVRAFLREVHAGLTSGSGMGYGPLRPAHLQTLADLADSPEGIPGWEDAEIPSTRLLVVGTDEGLTYWCASPDLDPERLAVVFEGDIDPEEAGPALDRLMTLGFGPG